MNGSEPDGTPTPPRFVVHFTEESPEPELLSGGPEDSAAAERRVRVARAVLERDAELIEWVSADPEHARLLLTDPAAALSAAMPDLEPIEISAPGTALVGRLLASVGPLEARVVTYTPPEVLAVELLRDVANDVGARPDGYAALFADVEGVVTAVATGRYGPDIVRLTVAGIARAIGTAAPPRAAVAIPPGIASPAYLDPDSLVRLAGARVEEEAGLDGAS